LVSLNAQAQSPDDPSQTLASDFHLLSFRAYMEELSASFNAQDQAPDDFHTGYVTIATYTIQEEEYGRNGFLGGQHCKGYEQEDAGAMGPS